MAISEGWKDRPPNVIQLVAPNLALPSTSVMPSRPMAPAAMSHRSFFTRSRSRRNSPSVRNSPTPRIIASSCLGRLPGTLEAVTARESVDR